jgi:hypothetical protein
VSALEASLPRVQRAEALAGQFLSQNGMGGSVQLNRDLGWSSTAERVVFDRTIAGIPVRDEVVKVVMFRDGSAIVEGNPAHHSAILPSAPISAEAAGQAARNSTLALEVDHLEIVSTHKVWHGDVLTWQVRTHVEADGDWHVDLWFDATTGDELSRRDLRIHNHGTAATGSGDVFIPNPVQTSGDHGMKDQNDSNNAVPGSEYFTVDLLDLDGSGYLTGPYCSTSPTSGRTNQSNLQFHFQRSSAAFEEVMTYYSMDSFQRYLQSVGQLNANNRQQKADVNGYSGDNSWYDMGNREITFGTGGVDDAEDADIIVHEYGHALHHDVQGGIGNGENSSMSEGYGDYFAASFYDDALVGEWDAVSYTGGNLHYLRRVDEDLYYPGDLGNGSHYDGQVWSAMLWDFRMAVGREIADNIIVEGMSLQSNGSGMQSGGSWLLTAEQQLYGGDWRPYLEWALHRRGIRTLGNSVVVLSPLDSTPNPGQSITLKLKASSHGGKDYKTLASLRPGPNVLGNPYNVTIHVGLDLLSRSLGTPGMTGTLNGSGNANISLALPVHLVGVPIAFQSAVFDSGGSIVDVSIPCAVRMGPY